jgi:hypothetical protein
MSGGRKSIDLLIGCLASLEFRGGSLGQESWSEVSDRIDGWWNQLHRRIQEATLGRERTKRSGSRRSPLGFAPWEFWRAVARAGSGRPPPWPYLCRAPSPACRSVNDAPPAWPRGCYAPRATDRPPNGREWLDFRLPPVVPGWKLHRQSCLGNARERWSAASGESAARSEGAESAPVSALHALV